ncbi:MAG: hypothetical protein VW450_05865 [Chloroflexota bacterium]
MRRTPALLVALALTVAALVAPVRAQEGAMLSGRVVAGVTGEPVGGALVSLAVLDGVALVSQESVPSGPDGGFSFSVVPATGRSFFVSVDHAGARYSDSRSVGTLSEPVELVVYEASTDPSVLEVDSHSILVTGAEPNQGFVEVLERVTVFNRSDTTLVADTSAGGMPNLLRFALPAGARNLDVRSNLVGGDILEVDRGFALTTPVPPTPDEPHQFEFVYRVDYEGDAVDLSRTLRFGARTLTFVVPVDAGEPVAPGLESLGSAELSGRFWRLMEGTDITPGAAVSLGIGALPHPTLWARIGRVGADWYLLFVLPAMAGLAAAAGLWWTLRRRAPALTLAGSTPAEQRADLLAQAAGLEEARTAGTVGEREYGRRRAALKNALVRVGIEERTGEGR